MKLTVLDPKGIIVVTADVTGSQSHRDAAFYSQCHINFGCQNGWCGACLIKVSEVSAFLKPSEREAKTLVKMNALPNERLACVSHLDTEFSGSLTICNAFAVYNLPPG